MHAGVALASMLTRASPAMLRYEPYESLSARGGWERQLGELEQPVCLAVGGTFVAAATDAHVVHVFTSAGVHTDEVAIGGAVVAVAAQGPLLAVAWHRGAPTAAGDQCLDLLVRVGLGLPHSLQLGCDSGSPEAAFAAEIPYTRGAMHAFILHMCVSVLTQRNCQSC